MFFGEMTMKKVLIAALLAGMSLSASAAQTIRFATEASYPPFELVDANNQIVGFDVDLANALCKEIDATCTFTNQAFDSLIPGLKFRRFDAVMAGMDITPEREKQVLFSTPYYDNSALFVGQQGKFTSIDQLKGKKVGVQNGTGLGIAVRQGNTDLQQKFNAALEKVKKDGTYQTIYNKWFQK